MIRMPGVLALCLLLTGFANAEDDRSLKVYAARIQGRHAYGVYFQGRKAGWSTLDIKLGKHDGKDALVMTEEMVFEIKRGGGGVKIHTLSSATYGTEGAGDMLQLKEETNESGRKATRTGIRKGDAFLVTMSNSSKERRLAPPKKNLQLIRKLEFWLNSGPKKDDTFQSFSVTLEDPDIDTKETYTFREKKALVLAGIKSDVHHVQILSKGAEADMELRPDGIPLKALLGGVLEQRLEPEALAKKLVPVEVDLLAMASIPIDRRLSDPERIAALTLQVTGLGKYPLPQTHRQELKQANEKDTHLLEVRRDFRPEKAAPLPEKELKLMREATPKVQSDEKKVADLAKEIVGEEKDVHKKAALIRKWVYTKLRKSYDANATTTLEVLKNRAGDCTEHSLLFVSLARASGLPAREVGGVGYAEGDKPMFGWHAWAEYHDGHHWISTDPTWNQERCDATHVKFSDSEDDMTWVNVLGKVKFKVVKIERK